MESANLKKLKEITPKLSELIFDNDNKDFVEYNVKGTGTSIGFALHKEPGIAVQRVFMSKGTIFPPHKHDEHEYVLVYKGVIKVKREGKSPARLEGKHTYDKEGILKVADGVYFEPGEVHTGEALEDAWLLSTTIPAGKGYPHAKR